MKLIFAIVHDDDALNVTNALNKGSYSVTKLCSSGGFLKSGNTTMLIGTEDDEVDKVLSIIQKNSRSRKQHMQTHNTGALIGGMAGGIEVTVGGATVFITAVDRMEKY